MVHQSSRHRCQRRYKHWRRTCFQFGVTPNYKEVGCGQWDKSPERTSDRAQKIGTAKSCRWRGGQEHIHMPWGEMCPKGIVPFILDEKLLKGRNSSLFKSAFTQAVSCKLNSPGQDEFPHATWTRYLRAGASVVSSYKHWSCVQEGHCSLSKVTASVTSYHRMISH